MLLVEVVIAVSVSAVESATGHLAEVVGMGVTLCELGTDSVGRVRVEAPLQVLKTKTVFHIGSGEGIPETDALFLAVLAAGCLVPVEGMK